jgi:hypothetical protein
VVAVEAGTTGGLVRRANLAELREGNGGALDSETCCCAPSDGGGTATATAS